MTTLRSHDMLDNGNVGSRPRLGAGLAAARVVADHLFSFELIFFYYLYSNAYSLFIPKPPVDETILAAGLCLVIAIWLILRDGLYRPALKIIATWLAFLGWAIASLIWSPSLVLAKVNLAQMASFDVLCLIGGGLVIASSRERVVRFLVILLIGSLVISFFGLWIYLRYGSFRFNPMFNYGRIYLLWGYAASAGAVIAYAIMLYSRFGSLKQIIFAFLFAASFYFLLVASGRGPLLSAALPCFVPLILGQMQAGDRALYMQKWQISALVIVVLAGAGLVYSLASGLQTQTFNSFQKLFAASENTDLVLGASRFHYYPAALKYWIEAPIIGQGISSFGLLFYGREDPGAHAHNIVLELLQSYGLVGFGLFVAFLWSGLSQVSRRRLMSDPLFLCVFLLFLSRLVSAQFSVDLPKHREMFTYLAMLAMRAPSLGQETRPG